jgi:SAM-dependent methyltransferase
MSSARWRRALRRIRRPLRFGTLRRVAPLSDHWGRERGTPIDRWYLDAYLAGHAGDIRGRALEVRDAGYIRRFGRELDRVDVLDIDPDNPEATIVGDLVDPATLPPATFDALVVTQVLQYVSDPAAAIRTLIAGLRPGGVLLLSVPGISRIGRGEIGRDYWRFTAAGLQHAIDEALTALPTVAGELEISIEARGNVLSAIAFLAGAAAEELRPRELDVVDDAFPVIVFARVARSP